MRSLALLPWDPRADIPLSSSAVLSNLAVYANSDASKPVAIATLHEANLRHFLQSQSISSVKEGDSLEKLSADKAVVDAVLKEVLATGKKSGFKGPELLSGLILDPEEWLVSVKRLAPGFKVVR